MYVILVCYNLHDTCLIQCTLYLSAKMSVIFACCDDDNDNDDDDDDDDDDDTLACYNDDNVDMKVEVKRKIW